MVDGDKQLLLKFQEVEVLNNVEFWAQGVKCVICGEPILRCEGMGGKVVTSKTKPVVIKRGKITPVRIRSNTIVAHYRCLGLKEPK